MIGCMCNRLSNVLDNLLEERIKNKLLNLQINQFKIMAYNTMRYHSGYPEDGFDRPMEEIERYIEYDKWVKTVYYLAGEEGSI